MTNQPMSVPRRRIAGERPRPPDARPAASAQPPDHAPTTAGPGARRLRAPRVPGWLVIGLAVMAVATIAFDLVVWGRSSSSTSAVSAPSAADVYSQAPAAAEQAAEAILSYDYSDLAADTTEARAYLTPAYGETFQKTVDDLLTQAATSSKGEVTATVMASGVAAVTGDGSVQVLLFVDQTSTTANAKDPQTALNRVVLTMVAASDGWLVDDVAAL